MDGSVYQAREGGKDSGGGSYEGGQIKIKRIQCVHFKAFWCGMLFLHESWWVL